MFVWGCFLLSVPRLKLFPQCNNLNLESLTPNPPLCIYSFINVQHILSQATCTEGTEKPVVVGSHDSACSDISELLCLLKTSSKSAVQKRRHGTTCHLRHHPYTPVHHGTFTATCCCHESAHKHFNISKHKFKSMKNQNTKKNIKIRREGGKLGGLLNMLYHALTRILTSPSWGSGIVFLVTLSLFRPPKPESNTARISFESGALTALSGSFAPFFSIICSVSSAVSVPSFAISAGRLTVLLMLLQQQQQQLWRHFTCSSARRVATQRGLLADLRYRLTRWIP